MPTVEAAPWEKKKAWGLNKERVQFIKALGDHINHMQRLRKVKHRGRKRGNRAANSDKYQALKRLQSVDTITSQSRPKYKGNTLFFLLWLFCFTFAAFFLHFLFICATKMTTLGIKLANFSVTFPQILTKWHCLVLAGITVNRCFFVVVVVAVNIAIMRNLFAFFNMIKTFISNNN